VCTFVSSSVAITYDPANRTTVRNVTLERCRVVGSSLRCASSRVLAGIPELRAAGVAEPD
jgi:hypothetical protein